MFNSKETATQVHIDNPEVLKAYVVAYNTCVEQIDEITTFLKEIYSFAYNERYLKSFSLLPKSSFIKFTRQYTGRSAPTIHQWYEYHNPKYFSSEEIHHISMFLHTYDVKNWKSVELHNLITFSIENNHKISISISDYHKIEKTIEACAKNKERIEEFKKYKLIAGYK